MKQNKQNVQKLFRRCGCCAKEGESIYGRKNKGKYGKQRQTKGKNKGIYDKRQTKAAANTLLLEPDSEL